MRIIILLLTIITMTSCGRYNELKSDYKGLDHFYDLNIDISGLTREEAIEKADIEMDKFKTHSIKRIFNNNIIKTIDLKVANVKSIAEFEVFNDKIIILDRDDNDIKITDFGGNAIRTIGKLGSGIAEFKTPSAFYFDEDNEKFYILDLGNERIVVMDSDFNFIKNVDIRVATMNDSFDTNFCSIVKDENYIYISAIYGNEDTQKVNKIDENGNITKYDILFGGFLYKCDNIIYAIESMRGYIYGNKSSNERYYHKNSPNGKMNLYELNEDKMKKVCNLPSMQWSTDMIKLNSKYYITSASYGCLDEFEIVNNELKYLRSVTPQTRTERDMNFKRFRLQEYNGNIFLSDYGTNKIYIIDPNK